MSNSFNNKHMIVERNDESLVVIGSRCQIYPIDDDTLKGETLTPWNNDKSLLIDKYDVRCWLSDLSNFANNQSDNIEEDIQIAKLCDDERYRDLNELTSPSKLEDNDIEEVDNPNRSGIYSSVNYTYEESLDVKSDEVVEDKSDNEKDDDIPYQLPPDLKVPDYMELPKTEKQAAKIEKTATFIASHGIQMEILLKAKQGSNKKFNFLTFDDKLNPFYKFLLDKIKNAEYIPAKRQLVHLTKVENSSSPEHDMSLSFPKVDISNTAYYKLINKYRSVDKNGRADSQGNEKAVNCDSSQIITDNKEFDVTSPDDTEDMKEKLYKSLYEKYYTYYYNYYYQVHNNTPMLQESNQLQIQEDSKSLAINAAAYAAKAGVEQYQKDQEESARVEKLKQENIEKKKQLCIIIKYVDYIMKHGSEFEYAIMSKSDKLKFLDPDNQNHSFYQHCLSRAKKLNSKLDIQQNVKIPVVNHYPKWEDFVKKVPSGNIQSAPKLIVESHKSRIIPSPVEQKLITVTDYISCLINAEEIGRQNFYSQQLQPVNCTDNSNLQANRKRKATEFLEKINRKNIKNKVMENPQNSHIKLCKKHSKKRKGK